MPRTILVRRFSLLDEDTLWLGTPDSIVESGGLLQSWNDLSPSPGHMNTTDAAPGISGSITQPTVVTDVDMGTSIELNSTYDQRATSGLAKLDIDSGAAEIYIWFVVKQTSTPTGNRVFWQAVESGLWGLENMSTYADGSGGFVSNPSGSPFASDTLDSATGYDDSVPHLIEYEYNGPGNDMNLYVDGVYEDDIVGGITLLEGFAAAGGVSVRVGHGGQDPYVAAIDSRISLLKINSGLPLASRIQEIRNYCRDNLGCSGIV